MGRSKLDQILASIPLDLIQQADFICVPAGVHIIRATEPLSNFYILTKGIAKLTFESKSGETLIIDIYQPGDFFGEMEIVGIRSTTDRNIVAITDCMLHRFARGDFIDLWSKHGEFSLFILSVLCKRLKEAGDDKIYAEKTFLREKIFRIIQRNIGDNGYFLYTKDVLAEMSGVSMRSLNRTLKGLQDNNLISIQSGKIRI